MSAAIDRFISSTLVQRQARAAFAASISVANGSPPCLACASIPAASASASTAQSQRGEGIGAAGMAEWPRLGRERRSRRGPSAPPEACALLRPLVLAWSSISICGRVFLRLSSAVLGQTEPRSAPVSLVQVTSIRILVSRGRALSTFCLRIRLGAPRRPGDGIAPPPARRARSGRKRS